MENNDVLDNQMHSSEAGEVLNGETTEMLGTLATWMNYAAILSMIGQGASLLTMIFTKNFSQFIPMVIGLVLAIILLNASKALKTFCLQGNSFSFHIYAKNIRNYFMVSGILIIIVMFFVLIGIFTVAFVAGSL